MSMNSIGAYRSNGNMMRNYFNAANAMTSRSIRNIASGYRINSAADDAAGLAISEQMNAQLTGLGRAGQNTQDAISMVRTADGILGNVSEITLRMKDLAVEAGNGILSKEQRASIQDEYNQLAQEIDRIGQASNFNGNKLFDGSTYTMQVGEGAGETREITMGEISAKALGLDQVNLMSVDGASKANDAIRAASDNVSSQRSALGAMENGMQHVFNNLNNRYENLTASVARIMDSDIAKEMMNHTKSSVLSQTSMAMMGQMRNMMEYNVLQLLR